MLFGGIWAPPNVLKMVLKGQRVGKMLMMSKMLNVLAFKISL
jgi:hypothetical protein